LIRDGTWTFCKFIRNSDAKTNDADEVMMEASKTIVFIVIKNGRKRKRVRPKRTQPEKAGKE